MLVNVSSQLAQTGVPSVEAYTASKEGMDALTQQLDVEHADDGVRVNAIVLGVDTVVDRAGSSAS